MPPSPGSALRRVWRRFNSIETRLIEPREMVRQLEESWEEIERLRRTHISRREHLEELGELATGLAHEIRNPLAGIAGVVEIIGRDLPAASPARAVVKDVRREITRINRILRDLLLMARPHPLKIRKSDLNATVEGAVIEERQQAQSRSVEIRFLKEAPLLEVEHDSGQVHQMLRHLLLNALQAIDEAGVVTVTVKHKGSMAVVEVTDNGRGIAAKNLPSIFRPFFTTKADGTGLGLPFARRIVEDHGGRIEVSSTEGKGTKFSVLLPLPNEPG
jgi:signal transduction histidine kinase